MRAITLAFSIMGVANIGKDIAANRVACIVLAAGRSTRFGVADKLAAELRGRPLLHHALEMLAAFDFAQKIVVCRPGMPEVSGLGFDRIDAELADGLQSDSLRAGIRALRTEALDAILIALGDMPAVSHAHIERLFEHFDPGGARCVIASASGDAHMPPALFAIGLAGELADLTGDQGARPLLRQAVAVQVAGAELLDVDTPGDLDEAAQAR